jgi:tripartite-type tricarboxylate transporter receptor subunit TctC
LTVTPWGGIFGPKGMPRDIAERLSRELIALLKRREVREAFGKLAFEPRGSTPEELAAFTREQLSVWRRAIADAGIKPE